MSIHKKQWWQANLEREHAKKRERYQTSQQDPEYQERMAEKQRVQHEAVRAKILAHYGETCACCGGTEWLSIDHINGGGLKHRIEQFGNKTACDQLYRWLIKNGFPDGFQVLCRACNSSKAGGERCRLHHEVMV